MNQTSLFPADAQPPSKDLLAIRLTMEDCKDCGLHRHRNNVVCGVGPRGCDVAFYGEGPGENEDMRGEPFVGRAGELLDKMIVAMGLARSEVFIGNVVACRPPRNRVPKPPEVRACLPHAMDQLRYANPKVVVALGATAANVLVNGEMRSRSLSSYRGQWHKVHKLGIPLYATWHPAYLLRSPCQKPGAWRDLVEILRFLGRTPP